MSIAALPVLAPKHTLTPHHSLSATPVSMSPGAVTVGFTPSGAVLLDPDDGEEVTLAGAATLVFPHARRLGPSGLVLEVEEGVLASHTVGRCGLAQYVAALDIGRQGAEGLASFLHASLAAAGSW